MERWRMVTLWFRGISWVRIILILKIYDHSYKRNTMLIPVSHVKQILTDKLTNCRPICGLSTRNKSYKRDQKFVQCIYCILTSLTLSLRCRAMGSLSSPPTIFGILSDASAGTVSCDSIHWRTTRGDDELLARTRDSFNTSGFSRVFWFWYSSSILAWNTKIRLYIIIVYYSVYIQFYEI